MLSRKLTESTPVLMLDIYNNPARIYDVDLMHIGEVLVRASDGAVS